MSRLGNPAELLLRQVHPAFLQAGRVSSQAFCPSRNHGFKLSVSVRSKTEPGQAYRLHVDEKGLASAGVWAVSVEECERCDLAVHEDPVETPVPDPAHAYIDFTNLTNGQRKARSQLLAGYANERGCLYTESR